MPVKFVNSAQNFVNLKEMFAIAFIGNK